MEQQFEVVQRASHLYNTKETFLSSIAQINGLSPIKNFFFFLAINLTILSQVGDQNLSNNPRTQ